MAVMMTWGSTTYLTLPLLVGFGLLVLILFLRWAYSPKKTSLIGEKLRQELIANNIKATLAFTLEGPQLMVWPKDETKARNLIRGRV